jgi:hypothetical protein
MNAHHYTAHKSMSELARMHACARPSHRRDPSVAQAGAVVFDYTSISKRLFEAVNSKTIDFEGQVPGSSDRYHSYASHGDEAEPALNDVVRVQA